MQLILFDIDGTLIEGSTIGRQVMAVALERVFGSAGPMAGYSLAGKTDRGAVTELMVAAGIPRAEIDGRLPEVYALMAEEGRRLFAGNLRPLPGVPALLQRLGARPGTTLGLLTGNCTETAPLKLAAAGIAPAQFAIGAYGSDDEDRVRLSAIALERAAVVTGRRLDGSCVFIFGDTPADIHCARHIGATAVAVASGFSTSADLARHQPDHLLADLADTDAVLGLLPDCRADSRG